MKVLLTILLTSLALHVAAKASDIQIVLSPWASPAQCQRVQSEQLNFILRDTTNGTRLHYYDGWHLKSIAEMTIPSGYRERKLQGEILKLAAWFRSSSRLSGELTNTAAIKIPSVLDELARSTHEGHQIVFVGSPIFRDIQEPQYSFSQRATNGQEDYFFPGDGLFLLSRKQSPFGVMERREALRGVTVHFLFPDESGWPNQLYREDVKRAWSLFVSLQGGEVTSFSNDTDVVLGNVIKGGLKPFNYAVIPSLGAQMLVPERGTSWRHIPAPPGGGPLPESSGPRTEKEAVTAFENSSTTAPFSIGIIWLAPGVDLDLHVITSPGAKALYFGNTNSSAGYYEHDYTDANDALGYESIHLKEAPSVDMEAWVNVYAVEDQTHTPITGKLMVRLRGKTTIQPFALDAKDGNRGFDFGMRPHWMRLNWQEALNGSASPTNN